MLNLNIPDLDVDDLFAVVDDSTAKVIDDLTAFFKTSPMVMLPDNATPDFPALVALDRLRISYTGLIAVKALADYKGARDGY